MRRRGWFVLGLMVIVGAGASGSPAVRRFARAHADADKGTEKSDKRFDPDSIKPAKGSARRAALDARVALNPGEARARALAGMHQAHGDEAVYLRWIAGQTSRELGDMAGCAEYLRPIADGDHPLSPWARLSVADCLEGRDPGRALTLLDGLLAPSRDMQGWPGRTQAERTRARVLEKLGRRDDAVLAYEHMASDARDESSMVTVLLPLAELLALGDESQRARAYTLTRRVSMRFPETRAGKRAAELGAALLTTLPTELQAELVQPRVDDRFAHADELAQQLRYQEAGDAYAEIEAAAQAEPDVLCRARYGRAKSLLDRRMRSEGSVLMAEVAQRCDQDTDRRAWARSPAGRAFSSVGQNEQAIAQFEALEREAPGHNLADDALYRAARTAHDMGDPAGLVTRLNQIFDKYPQGDMHIRARFALAWEAFQQGDLQRAIDTISVDDRDEPTEDLQGRSTYFRARWLSDAGEAKAAVEAFVKCFERNPLSYFGQLAHARLMSLAPERAKELTAKLAHARNVKLTFAQRPELSSIGFRRALALFAVNEVTLGSWELKSLGFTGDSADVDLALMSVALLERVDAPSQAIEAARRHMPRLMRRAPIGADVALYELVYPMAYAGVIEKAAKKEGAPPAFVRAVAREESGFNPDAVSRAHAYGLVQLLVPTAKTLVKTKAERVRDGKSLLRPELNLSLGARFMAGLASGFRHQYALVPPAYNAGPGAVARWLKERGHEPLDVWVENIPYDETRGYTRRVLQSYGVYHWLATHEMLRLSLEPTGGPQRTGTHLTSVQP